MNNATDPLLTSPARSPPPPSYHTYDGESYDQHNHRHVTEQQKSRPRTSWTGTIVAVIFINFLLVGSITGLYNSYCSSMSRRFERERQEWGSVRAHWEEERQRRMREQSEWESEKRAQESMREQWRQDEERHRQQEGPEGRSRWLSALWEEPQAGRCLAYNVREYTAQIRGPEVCKDAPLALHGTTTMPHICDMENGQIVGYFRSSQPDHRCRPSWSAFWNVVC